MSANRLGVAAAIFALALLGWLFFPGHTFLHSDTQIYMPILDRLWDPSLYSKDPVALRPHVSFTVYDEVALASRRITGVAFEHALLAQQILWRACGLFGAFLIGRALQLPVLLSLLVASVYGLGGVIPGPAVLIVEYEPVPRAFAGALLMLAVGLAAHGRWWGAGAVWGLALLYHPPTTLPLAAALALMVAWPWRNQERLQRLRAYAPALAAMVLLLVFARLQPGASEPQEFFGTVDAELEKLQRLRGSYNWVSMWPSYAVRQHVLLWLVCVIAWLRLRACAPPRLQWFLLAIPSFGLLTIALQSVLLEGMKWSFMTQLQPARAVMFTAAFAGIASAAAGVVAARRKNVLEAIPWFVVAFAIPAQGDLLRLLWPDLSDAAVLTRLLVVVALACVATLAARWEKARPRLSAAACCVAMAAPFWAMPGPAKVVNYPDLDEPELHHLARWARENTGKDEVFLFPEHGRQLQPGFFRVYAQRSIYVDWKSGGQANLLRQFAFEWWDRWQKVTPANFEPGEVAGYSALGIDYIVVGPLTKLPDRQPVYRNAKYEVYRLP